MIIFKPAAKALHQPRLVPSAKPGADGTSLAVHVCPATNQYCLASVIGERADGAKE
ncbi:hypothetical protein NQZ68_038414 [Dissostichus eleginoides]|nr:hypothetical protein NQZ68_038414 [Dissostichus eleginoides]